MTNKNKNIKALVTRIRSNPDSDSALIPTLTERVVLSGRYAETDENTSDLKRDSGAPAEESVPELHALVAQQTKRIQELEYQLQHAASRHRGLQKELEVREEITDAVNEDVRKARAQLTAAANEMESLHTRYQALQAAHAQSGQLIRELRERVKKHQADAAIKAQSADELRRELDAVRAELTDLRTYVDGRRGDWSAKEVEIADLRNSLTEVAARGESLSATLVAKEAELEDVRETLNDTLADLAANEKAVDRIVEENRSLKASARNDADTELRDYKDQLAAQAGELAARAQTLEKLQQDNQHLGDYADSLRIRLQELSASSRASAGTGLTGRLDAAQSTITEMTAQLNRSQTQINFLNNEKEQLKTEFEREVRLLRFELQNAQTTVANQELINEQVTSDLADSQGFREALESHLSDLEKESGEAIASLTQQLADARAAAGKFERKIRIKDGTISDLMKELVDRKGSVDVSHELESALHKIDGFRREDKRVRRKGERDHRVARMLIGEADGKELRFPLFKDRLTIGRTPHNDIQLNMRFISRRHAVIATDNNQTRIIDWGSRNGVCVNNKRVTEKILSSGDVITIGTTRLRFLARPKT